MKAVITAGGVGTRLYPLTRAFPKELIPILGKPIIEYSFDILKKIGITDVYIIVGHKKGALADYIGSGENFGMNIAYVNQDLPKGLGDAILCAKNQIKEDFIVLLGDTIFMVDDNFFKNMINLHKKENTFSTILIDFGREPERYGVVKFSPDGHVIDLYEKPKTEEIKKIYKINNGWYSIAGMYIFKPAIFEYLQKTKPGANNEIQLTDAIKLAIEDGKKILVYVLKGERIDVGSWDYLKDEKKFFEMLSEKELGEIISQRNALMEKIKNNKR